jgi:hypothetical protein
MRLLHVGFVLVSLLSTSFAAAEEVKLKLGGEIISGPKDPASHDAWLKKMQAWRDDAHKRIKYDDAQYRRPELQWAQRAFIQPQAMVEDRYFFDVATSTTSTSVTAESTPSCSGQSTRTSASTIATNTTCTATSRAASPACER